MNSHRDKEQEIQLRMLCGRIPSEKIRLAARCENLTAIAFLEQSDPKKRLKSTREIKAWVADLNRYCNQEAIVRMAIIASRAMLRSEGNQKRVLASLWPIILQTERCLKQPTMENGRKLLALVFESATDEEGPPWFIWGVKGAAETTGMWCHKLHKDTKRLQEKIQGYAQITLCAIAEIYPLDRLYLQICEELSDWALDVRDSILDNPSILDTEGD